MPKKISYIQVEQVDKQAIIKALESIGIEVADVMASPEGSLRLLIESINTDEVLVTAGKAPH